VGVWPAWPVDDALLVRRFERLGTPVRLFGGVDLSRAAYAPGLDGQRFLILRPTGEATNAVFSPLSVTLNWQQLLPR